MFAESSYPILEGSRGKSARMRSCKKLPGAKGRAIEPKRPQKREDTEAISARISMAREK